MIEHVFQTDDLKCSKSHQLLVDLKCWEFGVKVGYI